MPIKPELSPPPIGPGAPPPGGPPVPCAEAPKPGKAALVAIAKEELCEAFDLYQRHLDMAEKYRQQAITHRNELEELAKE